MTMRPSKREQRISNRMAVLPRRVEPWMLFTDAGELRHPAYSHGGFADEYHGWTITYHPADRSYTATGSRQRVGPFYRKQEIYKWARDNTLTGSP